MIVISDTSPITTLIQIGRVDLLHKMYGEILIPEIVRDELFLLHPILPDFFRCVPVTDRNAVIRLQSDLDAGEAEAIVLAKEQAADILLIDEIEGRKVAAREGLHFVGLLGVLGQAKLNNYIPSVGAVLLKLKMKRLFLSHAN
jgi:predicted nucleic acid-binding protein